MAPTIHLGVEPDVVKRLGIVAKDMHEILVAHSLNPSMCINALCLALAIQIRWGEHVGLGGAEDRAAIVDGITMVLTKNLELMDTFK